MKVHTLLLLMVVNAGVHATDINKVLMKNKRCVPPYNTPYFDSQVTTKILTHLLDAHDEKNKTSREWRRVFDENSDVLSAKARHPKTGAHFNIERKDGFIRIDVSVKLSKLDQKAQSHPIICALREYKNIPLELDRYAIGMCTGNNRHEYIRVYLSFQPEFVNDNHLAGVLSHVIERPVALPRFYLQRFADNPIFK